MLRSVLSSDCLCVCVCVCNVILVTLVQLLVLLYELFIMQGHEQH